MPEANQITFTYKEVAEMMVQKLGLKDGLWGIYMRFGITAGNVGGGPDDLKPSAIVPVLELGLQRFEEPSNLTVDAAAGAKTGSGKKSAKASATA